ncbi:hypothetical protein [Streptomyces sp. TLI_171]|uniref:hypothetical protein n=1 Tax=Streptomyces sp. TLI_171 TaxID=1938859 RepID=UPI000C176A8C|nr:hypothetical protein [Streptomyces sp. TLI_171]RKE23381.1 hypothetical protein BX266_6849 [Streptomyces sp. TLI_171]
MDAVVGARVDPELADRVTEALLLAGLPVAYGGHGPGVLLCPTGPEHAADPCLGAITLRWVASARLEEAAAAGGPDGPWHRMRESVADSMETALAEFLPALGIPAERLPSCARTRVGPLPEPSGERPRGAAAPAEPSPAEADVHPQLADAVRRIAVLAGVPVAAGGHGAGITVRPHASEDDPQAAGTVDLDWQPSRRLPRDHRPDSPYTAVRSAMRHALGATLSACGLPTSWHRPQHRPAHLHALPPAA